MSVSSRRIGPVASYLLSEVCQFRRYDPVGMKASTPRPNLAANMCSRFACFRSLVTNRRFDSKCNYQRRVEERMLRNEMLNLGLVGKIANKADTSEVTFLLLSMENMYKFFQAGISPTISENIAPYRLESE